jgi:hypothetical protein
MDQYTVFVHNADGKVRLSLPGMPLVDLGDHIITGVAMTADQAEQLVRNLNTLIGEIRAQVWDSGAQ